MSRLEFVIPMASDPKPCHGGAIEDPEGAIAERDTYGLNFLCLFTHLKGKEG